MSSKSSLQLTSPHIDPYFDKIECESNSREAHSLELYLTHNNISPLSSERGGDYMFSNIRCPPNILGNLVECIM
jgi:hypothetical protein